ncbi:MAG: hypothetical protein ABI564_07075 [Ideonella sp.]
MYYDPQRQLVVDYHGGLADARKKLLRMIGDPPTRYREDPVRIIRVVRFAAKLGFEIEAKTRKPVREMASLLGSVPPSRLFDEMFKLLQTGHSLASLAELRKQGLDKGIFPLLDVVLSDAPALAEQRRFVELALADTDRRVGEGKPVAPSFLLACLLWHEVLANWQRLKLSGEASHPALQQAIDAVFDSRVGEISGRGKLGADMREIWMMQPRFERRVGNGPFSLIEQPRFRAGFDFLRLRADVGECEPRLAEWWEDFSLEDEDARRAMVEELRGKQQKQRPRTPGQTTTAMADADAENDGEVDDAAGDAGDSEDAAVSPERKRRRRRRKPAAERDAARAASTPAADSSSH